MNDSLIETVIVVWIFSLSLYWTENLLKVTDLSINIIFDRIRNLYMLFFSFSYFLSPLNLVFNVHDNGKSGGPIKVFKEM